MKRFIFFLGVHLLFSSGVAQKGATLLISSDQSSLRLINTVYIEKGEKSIHSRCFNLKNILLRNLDSGRYQIKYITCFLDTIVEDIHIDKYKKIRISYPDKDFYRSVHNLDSILEYFMMSEEAELRVYIKSNIFDYTFYHQSLRIRRNQGGFGGYYSCHNYGPDFRKGLSDTTAYCDLPSKYIHDLLEFFYANQEVNNPNASIRCNHFSEVYLMMNRQYFYFNLCEDGEDEVFNVVKAF